MKLVPIRKEDLLFTDDIEDDRTNTYLSLDDYDWMSYKLSTKFKTKLMGVLEVCFEYFGMTTSVMNVTQIVGENESKRTYEYSTDIFERYIKMYLNKHIESWDSEYSFDGEDIVIEFFNKVLKVGVIRIY